jgi:hypothetical protein
MAVCSHCRSTLVRHDLDLENLGKMAELAEDRSPFRLRWRGRYKAAGFELIGRLQLRYDHGYWNEWYARFDDDRLGWLSEGSGLCYVTFAQALKSALPAFDAFRVGMTTRIAGTPFTVTNIEQARCVAAEGELPFRAEPGYPAPMVDLRSETRFASVDFSETPPKVYLGEAVTLDTLVDPGAGSAPGEMSRPAEAQARAFQCTNCGAPLTVRSGDIQAIGCCHCGAVVDPDSPELAILSRAREKLELPRLTLGGQGKLRGCSYTIIGFLKKRGFAIDGTKFGWDEYLLHSAEAGYAWLSCSGGHWSLGKPVVHQPKVSGTIPPRARFLGRNFRHFQWYRAEVDQVLGEFTWKVKIGDDAKMDDFVAPPYLLSREQSDTEQSWTLNEYVPSAEVAAAFAPERPLPEPAGVAPNQPSPHTDNRRYWLTFAAFAALALGMQLFFTGRAARSSVWQDELIVPAGEPKGRLTSEPFRIDGERNLEIVQNTDLDNRWLYIDLSLVNRQTGETFWLGRELSYYHGYDSDGSWSEGDRDEAVLLDAVPAGEYVLEAEAETEARPSPVVARIRLVRDVPVWSSFWLLLALLAMSPLWGWLRGTHYERRRWAESDHAGSD